MEEVGRENIFIFGLTADEVATLKRSGYDPRSCFNRTPELKRVRDMLAEGFFSPAEPGLFRPIVDALLNQGDQYLLLADYASYVACQEEVDRVYRDNDEWARRAIRNTANMGKFSSDRTIGEYARDIWGTKTVAVSADRERCLHEGVCVAENKE